LDPLHTGGRIGAGMNVYQELKIGLLILIAVLLAMIWHGGYVSLIDAEKIGRLIDGVVTNPPDGFPFLLR
jgi:hypothetical protein